MTQGMVAVEEVVVVVEEEESTVWGTLSVKAGRQRLAMLWGCPARV